MRCRPGDIAIIVMCPAGTEHLRGRIIQITQLAPPRTTPPQGYARADYAARWFYVGPLLRAASSREIEAINDCCLRPLRYDDHSTLANPVADGIGGNRVVLQLQYMYNGH